MAKITKKRSRGRRFFPSSLVNGGKEETGRMKISIIDYDEIQFKEEKADKIEQCFPFRDTPAITWINIDDIHQADIVGKIGEHFGLHPLVVEDIMTAGERAKMEDYESYIFIVLKMLSYNEKEGEIDSEEVNLILGKSFVISFQEKEGDVFDPVRERIRNAKGRIRKMGADYLAYSLIDAIVDNYFVILEKLGTKMDIIDEELVSNPSQKTVQAIHELKRNLIFLRKSIWPLREVCISLDRGESGLIGDSTRIYFRDVYDHTIQVIDTTETFRDMASSMLDIYLSSISNRMNEVMKVLTIFASIFIPLTFIAGVYGMNFEYMPELSWRGGYFIALGIMGIVALTMVMYFKRKKWF